MTRRKIIDIRNGIPRPEPGTLYRIVWDISDLIYADRPEKLRSEVLKASLEVGVGYSTASVAYCIWRKYRGLTAKKGEV